MNPQLPQCKFCGFLLSLLDLSVRAELSPTPVFVLFFSIAFEIGKKKRWFT